MNLNPGCFYNPADIKYSSDNTAELADKMMLVAAQIDAGTFSFLKMLAEFDHRKGWRNSGIRSCSNWLCLKCDFAYSTAREKVRVAHCLERLPKVNAAFEQGKIGYSQVRAITRVATDENEDELLTLAENNSANHMDRLVAKRQPVDENQQPIEQIDGYKVQKFNYHQDEDGLWVSRNKSEYLEHLFQRSGGRMPTG